MALHRLKLSVVLLIGALLVGLAAADVQQSSLQPHQQQQDVPREAPLQQQQQQREKQQALATQPASHHRRLTQAPKFRRQEQRGGGSKRSHLSGWHVLGISLLSLAGLAVLAFIGHKAMQWIERSRRPGYVELQSLDTAYHRPTAGWLG